MIQEDFLIMCWMFSTSLLCPLKCLESEKVQPARPARRKLHCHTGVEVENCHGCYIASLYIFYYCCVLVDFIIELVSESIQLQELWGNIAPLLSQHDFR